MGNKKPKEEKKDGTPKEGESEDDEITEEIENLTRDSSTQDLSRIDDNSDEENDDTKKKGGIRGLFGKKNKSADEEGKESAENGDKKSDKKSKKDEHEDKEKAKDKKEGKNGKDKEK